MNCHGMSTKWPKVIKRNSRKEKIKIIRSWAGNIVAYEYKKGGKK